MLWSVAHKIYNTKYVNVMDTIVGSIIYMRGILVIAVV